MRQAEERGEEESQDRRLPAQERPDHPHAGHVAEAHRLASRKHEAGRQADACVSPAPTSRPEQPDAGSPADGSRPSPGPAGSRARSSPARCPTTMPVTVISSGMIQQVVVDERRRHQQAPGRSHDRPPRPVDPWGSPTRCPRGRRPRRRDTPQEQQADQGLDQGIADRDRRAAAPALAPQRDPAHDRDVVPRRDRRPAPRASRARPDRRSSARESGRCRRSGSSRRPSRSGRSPGPRTPRSATSTSMRELRSTETDILDRRRIRCSRRSGRPAIRGSASATSSGAPCRRSRSTASASSA